MLELQVSQIFKQSNVKEKKDDLNQSLESILLTKHESQIDSNNLGEEIINNNIMVCEKIDDINGNINEAIKQQMDSWKYSTFEAKQFLLNIKNWQNRYIMFFQKVQEFYDQHPEIAKLTRENNELKKDQDYFEEILNKYQIQADMWHDKLKGIFTLKNGLGKMLKNKKKKASQMLIKKINMERVLESKKRQIGVDFNQNLKRGRSNLMRRNNTLNEEQNSKLAYSESGRNKAQHLPSLITSTEASRNMLSLNGSIQIGYILPSVSPQINGYSKYKNILKQDQQKEKKQQYDNNSSIQKLHELQEYDKYLNNSSFSKINNKDQIQQNKTSCRKERSITQLDVSPIIRNAKKQLATIENIFKVKQKGVSELSSYKNLSYHKDMKREKQRRLLQNQSLVNQSISTIGGIDDSIPNMESVFSRQILSGSLIQNKSLIEHQDSISTINQISRKDKYSTNFLENKTRIIKDSSVVYLDQNETYNETINDQSEDQLQLMKIMQQIKNVKDEIKSKKLQLQQNTRKFYRIEYFFEECLQCSERSMMKKIENLQLNGFELNQNMENLLNILDQYDDIGGIKQIVKKQNKKVHKEDDHQNPIQEQNTYSQLMKYSDFQRLSMKQILFSICRSNQMKYYFNLTLKQKSEQVKNSVNQIKQFLAKHQILSIGNQNNKNLYESIEVKNDSSFLDLFQDKLYTCKNSPTQKKYHQMSINKNIE